eukprot:230983_1
MNLRICGKWKLGRKLRKDSVHDWYEGTNINTGQQVIIKLEPSNSKNPTLYSEYKFYRLLSSYDQVGIPLAYYAGKEGDFNVLVHEAFQNSLKQLLDKQIQFTFKTILLIADQLLNAIEYIHSKLIIHRNLKPTNFVIPLNNGKKTQIYIIAFNYGKRYKDPRTHRHIPLVTDKTYFTGSPEFGSINTHMGLEQSRRDDLEQIGYSLLWLMKGSLPWSISKNNYQTNNLRKIEPKIGNLKSSMSTEKLCKEFPIEFKMYLDTVREIKFEDKPDYLYLKQLFRKVFVGYKLDTVDPNKFDWNMNKNQLQKNEIYCFRQRVRILVFGYIRQEIENNDEINLNIPIAIKNIVTVQYQMVNGYKYDELTLYQA